MPHEAEFQVRGVRDPQLAVHAASALPVWLWARDGTRVLWANAAGAAIFGASNSAALALRIFSPADQHRRQIARLAGRLPLNNATRLERLRGFGAKFGLLLTCACARFALTEGGTGVLVSVAEPVGRPMPYDERIQRLIDAIDAPVAAFTSAGTFAGANSAAMALIAPHRPQSAFDLLALGLDMAHHTALRDGNAEASASVGHVALQRIGRGADTTLLAFIAPPAASVEATAAEMACEEPDQAAPPQEIADSEAAPSETVRPETPPPVATQFLDTSPADADRTPIAAEPMSWAPQPPAAPEPSPTDVGLVPQPDAELRDEPPTIDPAQAFDARQSESAPSMAEPLADTAPSIDAPGSETPPAEAEVSPADEHRPLPDESPLIAAEVAAAPPPDERHHPDGTPPPASPDDAQPASLSLFDEPLLTDRRHPLRFMWEMDAQGRFALGSDEFSRLIGPRTTSAFGRLWSEIAEVFGLDPEGRVAAAIATRDTWSGLTINWPADGAGLYLPVELSGLPIYDRARQFQGYRGFGVCRDLEGLARLAAQRRHDAPPGLKEPGSTGQPPPVSERPDPTAPNIVPSPPPTETDSPMDTPPNVVPFRLANEPKAPTLTPVENNAFNELARQLASRLAAESLNLANRDAARDAAAVVAPESFADTDAVEEVPTVATQPTAPEPEDEQPTVWSSQTVTPPRVDSRRDTLLYDRMPVGILVYHLDRLLYANKAFLDRVGYRDLSALTAAGGLDSLYVEAGIGGGDSTSDEGTPVRIAATGQGAAPTDARLHSISWDGDPAHALIFSAPLSEPAIVAPAPPEHVPPIDRSAEELGTILDATGDGILICDTEGRIVACNRGAELLFGYGDRDMTQHHLTDLFGPDSRGAVLNEIEGLKAGGTNTQSRDVNGRARNGDVLPLSLTAGRTSATSGRFFAICRSLPARQPEIDPAQAKRQSERVASAKSDILARISHEVRTPLNSIIGFADVMIEERLGTLGNERYAGYMKDIRGAGERVLAIINDLLDLSRAESGKLDLTFARQDLNEMVEKCVSVMQPQANRERIIIRTSLAHALPPVTADAGALRQIVLNLVGNSIQVARAGGQVIVSTALTDLGDVVLRVRDTGRGLHHGETDATLEQVRSPEQLIQDNAGISLSLTKALVEANRAQFNIKSAPQSGTLVEVAFSPRAQAG
jgi:PAS domain S-box-containing protein